MLMRLDITVTESYGLLSTNIYRTSCSSYPDMILTVIMVVLGYYIVTYFNKFKVQYNSSSGVHLTRSSSIQ